MRATEDCWDRSRPYENVSDPPDALLYTETALALVGVMGYVGWTSFLSGKFPRCRVTLEGALFEVACGDMASLDKCD